MIKNILFLSLIFISSFANASNLDLSKYKGQVVYLDFWASWCGPCKESFPLLNQIQKNYPNVKIIAVNLDKNKKDADHFLKEHPADFEIIYNPDGKLGDKFKVKGMPYSIIFDKDGNEKFNHIGFSTKKSDQYIKEIKSLLEKK